MATGAVTVFGKQVKAPVQVLVDIGGLGRLDFRAGFCQGGIKGHGDWLR